MIHDGDHAAALIAGTVEQADVLLRKASGEEMSLIIYSTENADKGHFAWVNRASQRDVEKHRELARAAQRYIDWVATLKTDKESTDGHSDNPV